MSGIRFVPVLCVTMVLLSGTVGCQVISQRQAALKELPLGRISTGGPLGQSQEIEIPHEGITLDAAVARAFRPGLFQTDSSIEYHDIAVVLRRGATNSFLPLLLVQQHFAGSIPLEDGDRVELMQLGSTGFGESTDPAVDSARFSAMGPYVMRPGIYRTPGPIKLNEINQRIEELRHALATPPAGTPDRNVLVLTRIRDGRVDRYILPEPSAEEFGRGASTRLRPWLNANVLDGDLIEFTRLEFLPLIQSGLVREMVNRQVEEQRRRLAVVRAARRAEARGTVAENFKNVSQRISDQLRRLPELRIPIR